MSIQAIGNNDRNNYERILINVVRTLPQNRAEQLVDFARFLEAQYLGGQLLQSATKNDIEADNALWDGLLATDKGQSLLEKLASEAITERRAGKTKAMGFDDSGKIVAR